MKKLEVLLLVLLSWNLSLAVSAAEDSEALGKFLLGLNHPGASIGSMEADFEYIVHQNKLSAKQEEELESFAKQTRMSDALKNENYQNQLNNISKIKYQFSNKMGIKWSYLSPDGTKPVRTHISPQMIDKSKSGVSYYYQHEGGKTAFIEPGWLKPPFEPETAIELSPLYKKILSSNFLDAQGVLQNDRFQQILSTKQIGPFQIETEVVSASGSEKGFDSYRLKFTPLVKDGPNSNVKLEIGFLKDYPWIITEVKSQVNDDYDHMINDHFEFKDDLDFPFPTVQQKISLKDGVLSSKKIVMKHVSFKTSFTEEEFAFNPPDDYIRVDGRLPKPLVMEPLKDVENQMFDRKIPAAIIESGSGTTVVENASSKESSFTSGSLNSDPALIKNDSDNVPSRNPGLMAYVVGMLCLIVAGGFFYKKIFMSGQTDSGR